ncbi:MAG TPA: prepilin-type N-terminal cleavage/methylation domain-containing protein [Syntrophales bacterium]|nr:prepilin-type N-terminal cleavage/methylation domain-containing protein [Syntrophales bacterium]HOL58607.1 prepilin-type N-terminal cleavage/methylation domain-containing protein [Syntrophales bacterium]HPO34785.1 prepilin-type N-terminal cleavage/methylation domain-containing protein [Syntrophales bacterium]
MKARGYTLIELLVVVSIASIVVFIAVPSIRDAFYYDNLNRAASIISDTYMVLKRDASRESVDYILGCDLKRKAIFTYSEDMTTEKRDERKKMAQYLPGGVTIRDIYILGKGEFVDGEVHIAFSASGYTQPTIIHLTEKGKVLTIFLEPLLQKVKISPEDVGINYFLGSYNS